MELLLGHLRLLSHRLVSGFFTKRTRYSGDGDMDRSAHRLVSELLLGRLTELLLGRLTELHLRVRSDRTRVPIAHAEPNIENEKC